MEGVCFSEGKRVTEMLASTSSVSQHGLTHSDSHLSTSSDLAVNK
jgi:hypothetical protein